MKELWKVITKKTCILAFTFTTIYAIAEYCESFALAYFGTSPLTLEKGIGLTITIAIITITMFLSSKIGDYLFNIADIQMRSEISKYYFEKMNFMSLEKISDTHTGYINNLVTKVGNLFSDIIYRISFSIIPLCIGGTSIIYMLCKQSITIGIISIVISALAVFLKYSFLKRKQQYQKDANDAESKLNAIIIDFIQNITTVRKLNIMDFCKNKINDDYEELMTKTKINEKKRINANYSFVAMMDLLYMLCFVSVIFVIRSGQDGLPYLLFYISSNRRLRKNLNNLAMFIDLRDKFKATKQQLDEYFAEVNEDKIIENFNEINLNNIEFQYSNNSTKIIIPNFLLCKGDRISIMGESGQGKSTFLNILAKLYKNLNGRYLVDNKEIKNSRPEFVFVSQEVDMFDLSIRDNLCLGKKVTDEKIKELLEQAGLIQWLNELPEGLDTIVGERGIKLSAGQKQRLNIIRGLLLDKEFYIFDEPTSNLDIESEEKIISMIKNNLKDKTYIIVTHRPQLKDLCNKHYIFENHTIKEETNAVE